MLLFVVYGKPEPQGSMKAFVVRGRPIITSDNTSLKPWRQQVALAALAQMKGGTPHDGAVEMQIDFYFDRPKSVKKTALKITRPDIDKLERAVLDALTGIAYKDDAQVVKVTKTKQYGSPARVEIAVAKGERQ
jgi:crossover junction endodeoxyribonuclease RusA